jgi:diacylglycerol kinase (ATP)
MSPAELRTALVVNPTKVSDVEALHREVGERCAALGAPHPLLLETTPDDAGEQLAQQAVRDGATLVLVAGGDGTVRAVCSGVQRSGVPVGILPMGTGNLLARNLDLPLKLSEALDVALAGRDRVLDLGQLACSGGPPACFAVMAGIGFDAQMMVDAPERLKAFLGWPAYLVSGLRHLRDRPLPMDVSLDSGTPVSHRARGVVIGNVGHLQGGVALLPDALPDDGLLDVVVLAPRRLVDWGSVVGRLLTRSRREDRTLSRVTARRVEVRTSVPTQAQLDGDPIGSVTSLVVEVSPAAVVVRVRS